MTSKKVPLLPLIIGGAALLFCCCVAALVVVVGGLTVSSGKSSAVSKQGPVTRTPEGKTPTPESLPPAITLTSQKETQVAADGAPVADSHGVALTVPDGTVVNADGVVMTAALPPDTFAADLEPYGLERKSMLYSLKVAGEGENLGGAYLSFPASSPDDRLAVLLDQRFIAVLGVTPQDGRLVVTAAVSPGESAAASALEGGGAAYFVVAGGASAQSWQPSPDDLTAGFAAHQRPISWRADSGSFSPSREAVCYMSHQQPPMSGCPLGISLANADRSIIFNAGDTPEVRANGVSNQRLLAEATRISGLYRSKLFINHVPTPSDPLFIILDNTIPDPLYSVVSKKIYLDLQVTSKMDSAENQQTLAHEMFHWIEHKTYSMFKQGSFNTEFVWQMETRSEAASFLIDPQFQTAELRRKGAAYQSDTNQFLGWQADAFDWATDEYLGIKAAVEPARYIQGVTVRMGICTGGATCKGTLEQFAGDTNDGALNLFNGEYGSVLPNTAEYLLGFTPKVSYGDPGVNFAAAELQTGRGIGDFIHVSNESSEYVGLSCNVAAANLSKSKETGVVQINAQIGRQAIYPLRVSNGADYPLDNDAYTGKRAQPNVPYRLRIYAGPPFYYRLGSGALKFSDGKKETIIEPITSADKVTIQDQDGKLQQAPGIPVVRLVAVNSNPDMAVLGGEFAPMNPLFTTNPQSIKIPDLTTPVKLEINGARIFPALKSFKVLIDYGDGSPRTSLSATLQPDGTIQVTDAHTFLKKDVPAVTISFVDTAGDWMGWPGLKIPMSRDSGADVRPAFNMIGVEIIFGNTNYNPHYSYLGKSITWTGLAFTTTPNPFIQGTVSSDYKSITVNLQVNNHSIQLNDVPLTTADNFNKTYVYRLNGAAAILSHVLEDGGTPNWVPEAGSAGREYVNISIAQYPR